MEKDWYAVMGVSYDSTDEEIKKAYRKKALDLHPDRNPNNPEKEKQFKELVEAYKVLGNKDLRQKYDRKRNAASNIRDKFSGFSKAATSAAEVLNDFIDESLFDALSKFFKGTLKPQDIAVKLKIDLEDLYSGSYKTVSFKRNEICLTCNGRGAETKEDFKTCGTCLGSGQKLDIRSLFSNQKCNECKGVGHIIKNKCKDCKGKGLCENQIELTIQIFKDLSFEKGISKDNLIVENEGEHGGNLIITVILNKHKYYDVNWPNLFVTVPVEFYHAMLGSVLEIETLKGIALFSVPENTQDGDIITLEDYGLRTSEKTFGDLKIKIVIDFPKKISKQKKVLLEEYMKLDNKPKLRKLNKRP